MAEGIFPFGKIVIEYRPDKVFELPEKFRPEAEKLWRAKLEESRLKKFTLYDGKIFNLIKLDTDDSTNTLRLTLGQAGYKDYVVTRGHNFRNPDGTPIIANSLAICCAVITSDRKILIGRRRGVDGSINKYHIVGGFIDRDLDIYDGLPCPFRAIQREVREETGIELRLDKIICLGAIYDYVSPHPELCFIGETNLTYADTQHLPIAEQEVESWEYIENDAEGIAAFLTSKANELTSVAKANFAFYTRFKFTKNL